MTDKTEEQIARERAHVAAMKNAQASMTAVLSLTGAKRYISPDVYTYPGSAQMTVHGRIDQQVADANKVLGQ